MHMDYLHVSRGRWGVRGDKIGWYQGWSCKMWRDESEILPGSWRRAEFSLRVVSPVNLFTVRHRNVAKESFLVTSSIRSWPEGVVKYLPPATNKCININHSLQPVTIHPPSKITPIYSKSNWKLLRWHEIRQRFLYV